MYEDLKGGGVTVGGVDVIELGVVLLVERVSHVHGDAAEETFADVP
jgi:hypothetical protein